MVASREETINCNPSLGRGRVEREIFRVSGAEQFAIHVKPEYVATSWSVHAGFLQVTLPNKKIFRPNFLSEAPKDAVIKVGDIVKNVELYPNELKKKSCR